MIAAITGGRDYEAPDEEIEFFLSLIPVLDINEINHGARGAIDWGISTLVIFLFPHIKVNPWPVDESLDGPWPRAGNIRNGRMLRESKSEALLCL